MASWATHGTLVANTPTTVTLDKPYAKVQVVNDSTGTDNISAVIAKGTSDTLPTLTIGGDGTVTITPGASFTFVDDGWYDSLPATKVQLLSSGTPTYSVYGL